MDARDKNADPAVEIGALAICQVWHGNHDGSPACDEAIEEMQSVLAALRDAGYTVIPTEDLQLTLGSIASCVVGWGENMPAWAEKLWRCVHPLQAVLRIPLTDSEGRIIPEVPDAD